MFINYLYSLKNIFYLGVVVILVCLFFCLFIRLSGRYTINRLCLMCQLVKYAWSCDPSGMKNLKMGIH